MWNPESIVIDNLFAHKHSEYTFKNNVCTVIFGRNETDKGMENNGAGKTTLFEAISIALTNMSLRDIKKDVFINRESDFAKIQFTLKNDFLKMKLKIVRKFSRSNAPVAIEIWENDVLNNQITSVNDANKRVIDLLGISREDLLRYYIISQDSRYNFFTSSDVEKKEIMNRITSADMINPAIETLGVRSKDNKAALSECEREVSELIYRKELLEEQREELLNDDNTAEEIKELNEEIEAVRATISELKNENSNRSKTLIIKKSQIEEMSKNAKSIVETRDERNAVRKELDDLEEILDDNAAIIKKMNNELGAVIECPHCHNTFINESEFDLSEEDAKALKEEATQDNKKLTTKITAKKTKLERLNKEVRDAQRSEEIINELNEEYQKLERKIKRSAGDIADAEKDVEKKLSKIKDIKARKKDSKQIKAIEARIAEAVETLSEKNKELSSLSAESEMIAFWQYYLGKNGFTTYLANKSVKIIEGITNSFLKKFDVDLSVLINGFRILKDGSVREKIDVFVQSDGVTAEAFMGKSGGERGRVNLAGMLGIQHLINLSTNGRGLNLLLLDEVFPGIDPLGQENIIKIMEKLGITIMMITQNVKEDFNNQYTLNVRKVNDISVYE